MPIRKWPPLAGTLLVGVLASGCYQPLPLTAAAGEKSLTPPNMEVIRVQAKSIRHPLLSPVDFDERDGLSPDEAAILAVLANPALRAARDQRGIAAGQVIQAGILPNPTVSAEGELPVKQKDEVDGYTVILAWDVSGLVTLGAKMDAAKAQAASVELDIAWQEWQVAQAAKTAVYRCVDLELQLATAEQIEQRLTENAETVKAAVEQGLKTAVDMAAADAALQEAHTTVLDIRQDLRKERLALARTLGLPPQSEVLIQRDTQLPSQLSLPPAAELLDGLADRRLDLLALRRGYDSQEAACRAAILARFPKLELGILHAKDNGNFYKMGPTIAVDIPALDMNQGNIAIEQATRQKLFDEFTTRVFEARSDIATLLGEIESVTQKIAYAEAAVPVLERLVKTCEEAMAGGQMDILSHYRAKNDLSKKRIEILKLKQELVEMRIGLEIASGRYLAGAKAPSAAAADGQAQRKEALP